MGLIDASLYKLIQTGCTSNCARQNVASFLTKHLYIDWHNGAESYECILVGYDLLSNWNNWQYLAGVGNDPRGPTRIFNPFKQAFDYDLEDEYIKA
jgi:deoxyribodipyrimidine photo-lyase